MRRKAIILVGAIFLGLAPLQAQSGRADTAARTAATSTRIDQATAVQTTGESGLSFEAETDLGEQQPVGVASGGIGAYVLANAGFMYTSNPSLSNNGGEGDIYFSQKVGGGLRPNVFGNLYLDAHISQEFFEYAHFSSLNFSRFNVGGGLDYVIEALGGLTASVRYEYERYLDGRNFHEFYVNNAITGGLYKEFLVNDVFSIQTGGQVAISVAAEPSYARRNDYNLWLGSRWRILEPLELQVYYIVSFYQYVNDDRLDFTQNVGGSLIYSFTDWARVSASANFGANNSTDSYFDYTVVSLGGNLGLEFRF